MAVNEPKDLLARLADAGEEAIQKLGDTPGADRLLGAVHSMRERLDELQRRVRGIDALERRVAELEHRVDELSGKPSKSATSGTARKTTTTKASGGSTGKRTTTRKSSGSKSSS